MKLNDERGILICIALVFLFIFQFYMVGVQRLPSGISGGDYYYQLGQVYHMYESPFLEWISTSNGLGELSGYFFTYGAVVTIFGKILGLEPLWAMLYLNYLMVPISLLLFFLLYRFVFGSERIALAGALLTVGYTVFPILKYTELTQYIMIPLFLISLYLFFKKQEMKEAVILGLVYGLVALSHSTSFIFASLTIGIVFLSVLWEKRDIQTIKPMALAFLLGFLIAQWYWFTPIFVYHGNAELGMHKWTRPDYWNTDIAVFTGIDILKSHFFNFGSLLGLVKSILALYGAYLLFRKEKWKENRYATLVFASAFLLTYSYILTVPLLDTHFVPVYCSSMYLTVGVIMLILVSLKDIIRRYSKYELFIYAILALAILLSYIFSFEGWYSNELADLGKKNLPPQLSSAQAYLLENTSVDDVILSTNELSFGLNAVSGRKLMISRRSQNDAFMQDFDQRQLDAAAILYGNDDAERVELLKKYNVSYFYWEINWISSEFRFTEEGELYTLFDPLMVMDTEENREFLSDRGIIYKSNRFFLDPAMRSENIRKYDVLVVWHDNYRHPGHPWDYDLDQYLEKKWSYENENITIASLYNVDLPD